MKYVSVSDWESWPYTERARWISFIEARVASDNLDHGWYPKLCVVHMYDTKTARVRRGSWEIMLPRWAVVFERWRRDAHVETAPDIVVRWCAKTMATAHRLGGTEAAHVVGAQALDEFRAELAAAQAKG